MRSLIIILFSVGLPSITLAAGLTAQEKQVIQGVNATVMKAGARYAGGDFAEAGQHIRQAMKQVETAMKDGSTDLYDGLAPAMLRITKAHTMLEFEDVALPPFRKPKRPQPQTVEPASTQPKPRTRARRVPTTPPPAPEAMISFSKTVAPILVGRCGRCHVSDSKGRFNMATFAALMKGPPEGVVIFAGDTVGSRLIEVIETGDMPRGGGKLTPQELQTLKSWIASGAKFDGDDPSAPISGGAAPTPATADNPGIAVRRSTGKETVSFAADVAPLLVGNCNGCHIDAMQTRGGLRMDTFAQLLRGGDSGDVIIPGRGNESLLVQKLRGQVGEQMPAGGRSALSEESIKLIATWIDEGATLDGASESQPLRVMSQLAWAASATPTQISERRQQLASDHLKLVTASSGDLQSKATEHFYVVGTASAGTIDLVAQQAEAQIKTVKTVVSGESGESFYRGRATIFVFPRRYDYSEFAKMVESRGIPASWSSHWKYDGIDAYVALVATDRDEPEQIASRLLSPTVSLAVANRGGDVPRWLAEGVGVVTANRKGGDRDRGARQKMEAETSEAVTAMKDAKQFLEQKLTPVQTDRIGAAIATTMLDRTYRRNFDSLLRHLRDGKPFDRAFVEAFGVPPAAFVETWLKWARGG
jgi:mono/diheme cytochrome c family protein